MFCRTVLVAVIGVGLAWLPARPAWSDSKNSFQNSSNNSSEGSTDSSSRDQQSSKASGSSQHKTGMALSVPGAILVLAGVVTVGVMLTAESPSSLQQEAEQRLAGYLRHQHPAVAHDLLLAEGPVLEAWASDLGLTGVERLALQRTLEGSEQQGVMLRALDSKLEAQDVRAFAEQFIAVARKALGEERLREVVVQQFGPQG